MTKSTEEKLDEILWRIDELTRTMGSLLRQRRSDKHLDLQSIVKERGRVTISQVIDNYEIARGNALRLMKNVGKLPGFACRVGNRRTGSVLVFSEARRLKEERAFIASRLKANGEVRLAEIMSEFRYDVSEAHHTALSFVEGHEEAELMEHTITKRTQTRAGTSKNKAEV